MISGLGLCVPLEGGISAESATAALGATWSVNYQPWGRTAMLRAHDYGTAAWSDTLEKVRQGEIDFVLMLNEPDGENQDNLPARDAARILSEWNEHAWTMRGGQWQRVPWGGLNVLLNGDAGYAYERAYLDAGGPTPRYRTAHDYAYDAAGLQTELDRYRAHVDKTGGGQIMLTEVGGAPGIAQDKRLDVLRRAFRLGLEAWAWFSSRMPGVWAENDLMRADGTLTALGQEFRRLVRGEPLVLQPTAYFPVIAA